MERAAAEVGCANGPAIHDWAAQPSTPRDAERDRAVTAIVTTTSRKRLEPLRAEERSAEHGRARGPSPAGSRSVLARPSAEARNL
jgi:hypothetical protein